MRRTPLERFEDKFHKDDENICWFWQGSVDQLGYGMFKLEGVTIRSHRASYQFYRGEIPKGLKVLHSCDNRDCVNPKHLSLGTQRDNIYDMMNKDRQGFNKLKREDVLSIRKLLMQGLSQVHIAQQFKVDQSVISRISTGNAWSHV